MRIGDDLALQMAREQPGLHLDQPAHGDVVPEEGVGGLLLHAALEGCKESLAATGLEGTRRSVEHAVAPV